MLIHVLSCSSDNNISVTLQILRKFDCFKKPLLHTFEVTRNVIEQFIYGPLIQQKMQTGISMSHQL